MVIGFDAKRAFHNTSGLGNYSRDLIRILSNQFPENDYLLYNPKKGSDGWLGHRENTKIAYPEGWFWRTLSSVWRQGPIARQIKADGVDLYHGLSNEIPRGIDKSKTRVLVSIHDLIFIRFSELFKPIDRRIYFNKFKYAAENADLIIAISNQTKMDIVSYFRIPENRIVVHYQGCHQAFKTEFSESEKENVRRKLQLPENYILNVGTIEKRKNILTVVKALKDSSRHLVIVGRATSYKDEVVSFIQDAKMEDRIHFVQNVDMTELAIIYQMADTFCYPSIFEGFGIPIIEALFSGIPVIASEGGCFPEAGGPATRYVDPHNISAWYDAIHEVGTDKQLANQMVDQGLRYVQKFTDDNVGNSLMSIYQSII